MVSPSRRSRLAIIGLVLFGLVIVIGLLQPRGLFMPVDRWAMLAIGQARGTVAGNAITGPMIALSLIGDTIGRLVLLFGVSAYLYRRHRMRQTLWLIGAVVGMTLINSALKDWFQAVRPALIPHLDPVTSYSFPSGHASGNMAFFGALALLFRHRAMILLAAAMILAIGISRVWLGVHWPSDVAAGWIAGAAWLALWGAGWRSRETTGEP